MRQQALVLTNEDLAFTQDEIKGFFQEVRGISFNAGQLKKISLRHRGMDWGADLVRGVPESISRA